MYEELVAMSTGLSHSTLTEPPSYEMVQFRNVLVDGNGLVVEPLSCVAVRNSACWPDTKEVFIGPIIFKPPTYDIVVSLAEMWGHGYFHFVLECLVTLMTFPLPRHATLHVSTLDGDFNYILGWLQLLNIKNEVVSGTVRANILLLPALGVGCGEPSEQQLLWLREQVRMHANITDTELQTVVIVYRQWTRLPKHWASVVKLVVEWAESQQLQVFHHRAPFDSIADQLRAFGRAKLVVAPHGAAETFLVASSTSVVVFEYFDADFLNTCYARMAFLLGQRYMGFLNRNETETLVELRLALTSLETV